MKSIQFSRINILCAKSLLFLALSALVSSCDCPEFNTEATINPQVDGVTITKFNSGWIGADTSNTGKPVSEYSIHTFLFPEDVSSSGTLPNDERVSSNKVLTVASETYTENNITRTALVYVDKPTNALQAGDILVDDAFVDHADFRNSRAYLRFAGALAPYTAGALPLYSSSAGDFADYLRSDPVKAQTEQLGGALRQYGQGLANANSGTGIFRARLTDARGRIISDTGSVDNLTPRPPDNVRDKLRQAALDASANPAYAATIVEVRIGEVYYYKAKNGTDFAVFIENIDEGNLDPRLRRVTIRFARLKGPSCAP